MEEDYAEIYYVDPRNGGDHRTSGGRPASGRPVPPPTRAIVVRSPQAMTTAPVTYVQPTGPAGLLANLSTGQVVEMVAQIFAALQGLPVAPVATKDVATDVGNLVLYQGALAQHAKRDEQLRTLGALVARLVS